MTWVKSVNLSTHFLQTFGRFLFANQGFKLCSMSPENNQCNLQFILYFRQDLCSILDLLNAWTFWLTGDHCCLPAIYVFSTEVSCYCYLWQLCILNPIILGWVFKLWPQEKNCITMIIFMEEQSSSLINLFLFQNSYGCINFFYALVLCMHEHRTWGMFVGNFICSTYECKRSLCICRF